jgi:hypothetical protein
MQVEMADIDSKLARPTDSDESIHIGPVHIDLPPAVMDRLADLPDRFLEDPVCRRVGDHERSQARTIRLSLGLEIFHINIALLVTFDGDDLETCHHSTGWIGPVG